MTPDSEERPIEARIEEAYELATVRDRRSAGGDDWEDLLVASMLESGGPFLTVVGCRPEKAVRG